MRLFLLRLIFDFVPNLHHFPVGFFFFNVPTPPAIYPLSLHDALPIFERPGARQLETFAGRRLDDLAYGGGLWWRSEEHTSELQSHVNIVCRLLLEKKNDIAFDADPKFFPCLVRFESSSVPTTLPTAYD